MRSRKKRKLAINPVLNKLSPMDSEQITNLMSENDDKKWPLLPPQSA